jgi:hypothetical protein
MFNGEVRQEDKGKREERTRGVNDEDTKKYSSLNSNGFFS